MGENPVISKNGTQNERITGNSLANIDKTLVKTSYLSSLAGKTPVILLEILKYLTIVGVSPLISIKGL